MWKPQGTYQQYPQGSNISPEDHAMLNLVQNSLKTSMHTPRGSYSFSACDVAAIDGVTIDLRMLHYKLSLRNGYWLNIDKPSVLAYVVVG